MDAATPSRPRIEGRREQEIYEATLALIAESGYDRLTLDAVAARARASKATLYRRWSGKADLVTDAVCGRAEAQVRLPDTGSLRGDLMALAAAKSLLDPDRADVLCGLATAMFHDAELHALLGGRFRDERRDVLLALLERARDRGQVRPDADLDLLCTVVQAVVLYKLTYANPGELPAGFVELVIDQVLLPACRATGSTTD